MAAIHQSSSLKPAAEILLKTDAETTETTVARMKLKMLGHQEVSNRRTKNRFSAMQFTSCLHHTISNQSDQNCFS